MLEMLNVTRGGIPTLAGIMNFCIYPQGIFPQYSITAVVVPGYEIGDVGEDLERFMDNRRICGTISEMVEEAVGFCKRNMKVKTIIDPDTGEITEAWLFVGVLTYGRISSERSQGSCFKCPDPQRLQ